jgi:hypothetical protein
VAGARWSNHVHVSALTPCDAQHACDRVLANAWRRRSFRASQMRHHVYDLPPVGGDGDGDGDDESPAIVVGPQEPLLRDDGRAAERPPCAVARSSGSDNGAVRAEERYRLARRRTCRRWTCDWASHARCLGQALLGRTDAPTEERLASASAAAAAGLDHSRADADGAGAAAAAAAGDTALPSSPLRYLSGPHALHRQRTVARRSTVVVPACILPSPRINLPALPSPARGTPRSS